MRLIEKVWFKQHAAKWLFLPLLLPLSAFFWLLSAGRRLAYHSGFSKAYQLTKPVIVVGNIGVGGNGKTPVVIYLVELTRKLGLTPGVISRGYGGQAPHYPYMVDDKSTPMAAGDEPVLIHQRCQVPVVVGSDRVASAQLLIEQGCDVIISDDGLQHYRLKRDVELIIVDGNRLFGNGLLLPAGPLREGTWRLAQSDLVLFNSKKLNGKNFNGKKPNSKRGADNNSNNELSMTLVANHVRNLQTGEKIPLTEFLAQYPTINAIAGIGDPERFFNTLLTQQFTLMQKQGFVDHHAFNRDDFIAFKDDLPLLMTEKDAVKCQKFAQAHWWYMPVDAQLSEYDQQVLKNKIECKLAIH